MGTTADKLALLVANKQAIRDAITEKTGEDAGEVMSTYAEKIMNIQTGPEYWRTTILLDQTITDPASMITKVYDNGGIGLIRANSHRYVGKVVDGVMQAKQLQDGNGTLYLDGTTADLTGAEGDVFMKLPEFWYKAWSEETDKWYITFAYGAAPDSDFKHWGGKDFIGVYEAYVADSNVYSRSGVASTGAISQANFKTYARNRGEGYTLVKWKHHCIMAALFAAEYQHINSQYLIGYGTASAAKTNGQTDLLGMEDTSADVNGNTQSINYFGLENWWGNKYEFVDNVEINNRVWAITNIDGSALSLDASSVNGYISKMVIDEHLNFICKEVNAAENTGYCDFYTQASGDGFVALVSGALAESYGGVFSHFGAIAATNAGANYGSRLAYRGEYEEYDGVFAAEYSEFPFTSNGNQYFDTDFKPNQDTRVVMDYLALGSDDSAIASVVGSDYAYTLFIDDALIGSRYGTQTVQYFGDNSPAWGDRLEYDKNKNVTNVGGYAITHTAETFQLAYSLTLLARNTRGSIDWCSKARLYSCKIYDNGTLIRDYIPCIRKVDGERGLWDKVNKTFNTPITIA